MSPSTLDRGPVEYKTDVMAQFCASKEGKVAPVYDIKACGEMTYKAASV
jgi:hypothetical protein